MRDPAPLCCGTCRKGGARRFIQRGLRARLGHEPRVGVQRHDDSLQQGSRHRYGPVGITRGNEVNDRRVRTRSVGGRSEARLRVRRRKRLLEGDSRLRGVREWHDDRLFWVACLLGFPYGESKNSQPSIRSHLSVVADRHDRLQEHATKGRDFQRRETRTLPESLSANPRKGGSRPQPAVATAKN